MVTQGYFNVRYGARFPDNERYKTSDNTYVFRGMEKNPWWHGYLATNYIKAVIYATRVGDAVAKLPVGQLCTADTNYYSQAGEIINDLGWINWTTELARMKSENTNNEKAQKQKNTAGFHRAVIWGMAIHSATDTYAHSVRYNSEYLRHVKGDNGINIADDPYTCHWRYEDAQQVARKIMSKYTKSGSVTTSDLLPDKVPTEYKLYNLYTYVKEEEGQSMAADVLSYSYQNSTK